MSFRPRHTLVETPFTSPRPVRAPPPRSFRPRKRPRTANQEVAGDDCDDGITADLLPSDTRAGLLALQADFPHDVRGMERVAAVLLRNQLYCVVAAGRGQIDAEVEQMRSRGELRLLRLGGSREDVGFVWTVDYLTQAEEEKKRADARAQEAYEVMIEVMHGEDGREESVSALVFEEACGKRGIPRNSVVSELVKTGFLLYKAESEFWWTVPGIGKLLSLRREGNAEVCRIIRRKSYAEMLLDEAEKLQLRKSPFGVQFHLRDLLGAQALELLATTAGSMLRQRDGDDDDG